MTLIATAGRLLESLEHELAVEETFRDTHADDKELRQAIEIVRDLEASLLTRRWRPDQSYPRLARMVNDRWSWQSTVAADLVEFESLCRKLAADSLNQPQTE